MKRSAIKCPICDSPLELKKTCDKCMFSTPSTRVMPLSDGIFLLGEEIEYSDTPIGRTLKKYGPKYDYGVLLTKPLKYGEDK